MAYQSEHELEEQFINLLVGQGYERVSIKDEDELKENFRKQLFKFNKDKLSNLEFTDKEFKRILIYLEGKSIFKSSKLLRDKFVLEREDGSEVYIDFFDEKNFENNIFQVTNQVTMVSKYVNRYDVTILINGFPIVQVELKARGNDFKEAFNQIERYRRHSFKGLYRYIQCFVISNGVDTKYYANCDKDIKFEFTFFWSDEKNNRISNLNDFAKSFLDKKTLNNIIGRYMIINETDKNLMVMRPYQIHAVEALMDRAENSHKNGYIWHTTGSGKTLTSFKASQLLSKKKDIKKVFFLIDRKDLDSQTVEEFNKFEKDCIDTTDNIRTLLKQIKDVNSSLIVTTIQKLSRLLKSEKYEKEMEKYKEDKVVFIIDECHRSQFGEMNTAINKHFKHAQYFGFTGTPRLPENKSNDGRTTADIFDNCLHTYLIKDAINDGNVLGFSVEYIKTFDGDFNEYDDERVEAIDKEEVFMEDERIQNIAHHIIQNHDCKTLNRKFCSLFAVQSIPMLIKYYHTFKSIDHNLKIAGIFTFDANENLEGKKEHSRESLERIIDDYNKLFKDEDLNFSTDTFQPYFKDICTRLKNAEIDIVLVVDMLLTGFDSKVLNTLYVDKELKYHRLLQAYSRTNRIYDASKQFGNIVCYRNLKKRTDDAIKLFSTTDNTDVVLMKDFNHYMALFKESLKELYNMAPTVDSVDLIQDENEKKKFVETFRELTKNLTSLKTFVEFDFSEEQCGISEQKYRDYRSKYMDIHDKVRNAEKTSILADIDFGIELMHTDKINVSYILNLIRNIDFSAEDKVKRDIEKIKKILDGADNADLRLKSELIREFLEKVVPKATIEDSIDKLFSDFVDNKREEEIQDFASEVQIEGYKMKDYIKEYEYSGKMDVMGIKDNIKGGLLKKKSIAEKVKSFIVNNVMKFTF